MEPASAASNPRTGLLVGLGLITVVVVAYQGALGAGFVFDDHLFLRYWCWQILSPTELLDVPFTAECTYRRTRYLSLALDHLLWGRDPFGYHLTNLLLHLCSTLLLLRLLRRLGLSWFGAAAGALLWALHPVHTDAVTYVAGRRDVLAAALLLAALTLFPRTFTRRAAAMARAVLALALFALAFESKEVAIVFPALLLLERLFGPSLRAARAGQPIPSPWRELLRLVRKYAWVLALFALLVGAGFIYRAILQHRTSGQLWGGDLYHHLLTIPAAYARYAELTLFPWRLYGDYSDYPPATGLTDPRVWLGAVFLAAVWIGGISQARHRPWLAFGMLWYGVSMLPMSQIVPHHELLAEHYLYIPLMGLGICVARSAELLWARRRILAMTVGAVALLYGIRVAERNRDFATEEAFARVILAHEPDSIRGRLTLVHALQTQGRLEEAIEALDFILARIGPENRFHHTASENLLTSLTALGDLGRAERQAFAMFEDYPRDAYATRMLGSIRARQGQTGKAIIYLQAAVEGAPQDVEGHLHLGVALMEAGRLDEAEPHLELAASRWRGNAEAQLRWALLPYERGEDALATERLEHVLSLDPGNVLALERLLLLASRAGDRERTCAYYRRLLPQRPDLAELDLPCSAGPP